MVLYCTAAILLHSATFYYANYPIISLLGGLLEAKERGKYGQLKVAYIYFSCALFSILAVAIQETRSFNGASAGSYGLIGAHLGKNLFDKCKKKRSYSPHGICVIL